MSGDTVFQTSFGEVFEKDPVALQPLTVGLLLCNFLFDLCVINDATFLGVYKEHAAGLKAAFFDHGGRVYFEHSDLGGHNDKVLISDIVTRWTKTITVEDGSDGDAVTKSDGCRSVPWFHESGVVFVERLFGVTHVLVIFPWLGNHHHNGFRQAAPGKNEEFKAVVKHRRV